jgi:hypothetical protein
LSGEEEEEEEEEEDWWLRPGGDFVAPGKNLDNPLFQSCSSIYVTIAFH